MAPAAAYDDIADWYEEEFLGGQRTGARTRDGNPLDLGHVLRDLLGEGSGACLEVGCGTGVHAAQVRELGWTPVGVDLSAGMLRHARGRLPIAQADAERLPARDDSLPAVVAMMVHTDMPGYPAVLREVARVLRPGGMFVHVGIHPCFCGGFADRSDLDAVVIRPGYLNGHWTMASWTDQGVRAKVGATHRPLPELMHAFLSPRRWQSMPANSRTRGAGRLEFGAAGGDLRERGAVGVGELAGRGEDPAGHLLGCWRWRGRGDGGVAAELGGEPAQGAQAAAVAAAAQLGMQLLGAADPFVPPLPQPVLVRAEQARPGQPGAAGQLVGGRSRGVAADRLGVQP
jgi:SAM-dependent methyltransferase